jgi:hypothetical protein
MKGEGIDSGYLKLPVAVVVPLFAFVAGVGGAGGGYLQKADNDKLTALVETVDNLQHRCQENGDIARAAANLATANQHSIGSNLEELYARTAGRYTTVDYERDSTTQAKRDALQERRLDNVERDIERLERK